MRAPSSIVLTALVLASCASSSTTGRRGSDTQGGDDTVATDDTGGGEPGYPQGIRFRLVHDGQDVRCDTNLRDFGAGDGLSRVRDARLFVSDLVLSGPEGDEPVRLAQASPFQTVTTALLDFEAGCDSVNGTEATHTLARGTIVDKPYTSLSFTLGVPFDLNHLTTEAKDPPLDDPYLYRFPQEGHSFVRIDIANDRFSDRTPWRLDLHSAGCGSPGDSINDIPNGECSRPNRPRYTLPFDPFAGSEVIIDLGAMFANVDVRASEDVNQPGCQVRPDDTATCAPVFTALGLDYRSGVCVLEDCSSQVVFRSE